MRGLFRIAAGGVGLSLLGVAFIGFFHLVPSSWGLPSDGPVTVTDDVRMREGDGWSSETRTRIVRYDTTGDAVVVTQVLSGSVGPKDREIRAVLTSDLRARAAGAADPVLLSFPGRSPFEDRPERVPIAELRMSEGVPTVVAMDTFEPRGTTTMAGLTVEVWVAEHGAHRFLDDGRRFERVVERRAYVEPLTGIVVASTEHERLWIEWRDRFRSDPVTGLIEGAVRGNAYLPVWDAWTNTTSASAKAMAATAERVRESRLVSMVGLPAPALLAGELALWMMIRPPRSLFRRDL